MSKEVLPETEKYVPPSEDVFKLPLLSKLVGKQFFIGRVEFDESSKGEYAVLDIVTDPKDGKVELYRTSGKALLTQLRGIRKVCIDTGKLVEVKLGKVKGDTWNYLSFVDF